MDHRPAGLNSLRYECPFGCAWRNEVGFYACIMMDIRKRKSTLDFTLGLLLLLLAFSSPWWGRTFSSHTASISADVLKIDLRGGRTLVNIIPILFTASCLCICNRAIYVQTVTCGKLTQKQLCMPGAFSFDPDEEAEPVLDRDFVTDEGPPRSGFES